MACGCTIQPTLTPSLATPSQTAVNDLLARADREIPQLAQRAFAQTRKLNREDTTCLQLVIHHIQILQNILRGTKRNRAEAYAALLLLLSTPCS